MNLMLFSHLASIEVDGGWILKYKSITFGTLKFSNFEDDGLGGTIIFVDLKVS